MLADGGRTDPLWLGFVENYEAVNRLVKTDVRGFMVLLPADAPRHVAEHHAWDGAGQRPPQPQDYQQIMDVLTQPDRLRKGDTGDGMERVVAEKSLVGEVFRAVFEVRPGKKNRALTLVTLAIKTSKG